MEPKPIAARARPPRAHRPVRQ